MPNQLTMGWLKRSLFEGSKGSRLLYDHCHCLLMADWSLWFVVSVPLLIVFAASAVLGVSRVTGLGSDQLVTRTKLRCRGSSVPRDWSIRRMLRYDWSVETMTNEGGHVTKSSAPRDFKLPEIFFLKPSESYQREVARRVRIPKSWYLRHNTAIPKTNIERIIQPKPKRYCTNLFNCGGKLKYQRVSFLYHMRMSWKGRFLQESFPTHTKVKCSKKLINLVRFASWLNYF